MLAGHEHQNGGSQTQANTAATAVGVVGALAVGAGIGAGIGIAVTSLLPASAQRSAIGATIGATIGAGVSGVAAAGLVHSGGQALGKIESDTDGTRYIVAKAQQRISLSTTQNASAVRSLWTTGGPDVRQSLRLQLGLLFDALFEDAPPANAIQLVVSYSYPLSPQPDLPWITVPVLMLPLTSITTAPGSGPGSDPAPVGTVLDDVAAAIGGWFGGNATAGSGQLVFQLTVMSHLTKTATPLL